MIEISNQLDIHPTAYVSPHARIYGTVKIGAYSSVWDGAVIRGDLAPIEIGENTSIQEHAVIHVDSGFPVKIGNNVTIGHQAVIHGASIGDYCIIAIKAAVLNGATVGDWCIIGAGAIVMERENIPDHSVVFGIPGRVARKIDDKLMNYVKENAREYVKLGQAYKTSLKR